MCPGSGLLETWEKERERERYILLYIYIYINIYYRDIDNIDRDIERERLSENGRPCHANLWNHTQPENPPHLCRKKTGNHANPWMSRLLSLCSLCVLSQKVCVAILTGRRVKWNEPSIWGHSALVLIVLVGDFNPFEKHELLITRPTKLKKTV